MTKFQAILNSDSSFCEISILIVDKRYKIDHKRGLGWLKLKSYVTVSMTTISVKFPFY